MCLLLLDMLGLLIAEAFVGPNINRSPALINRTESQVMNN